MNPDLERDDATLARAAQAGDHAAFEALLTRYETRLFGFLRQLARNAGDAEDLAQTVWVSVHRQLHRYDPGRPFPAWLFTIARNAAISAWRRQRTDTLELQEHDWVDHAHPAGASCDREEAEGLWAWIAQHLGQEQREALWLMYREDMGMRDIARVLGCSTIRAKVMIHRARKKLLQAHATNPSPVVVPAMKCGDIS